VQALLLIWSALWRVQASHLVVFVLVPVAVAAFRAALGIVLFPLLLIGFGNHTHEVLPEIDHLRHPGCWIALAPCTLAELPLLALPGQGSAASQGGPFTPEPEPFLPVPKDFSLRHAWFIFWLIWFVLFVVRRARKRSAA
jgi:hypothetical protein